MSLSYLWQQMPALNQAGELISLKNTPGKTREGSARWQRQGHANAWVSTRWRGRLHGGSCSPACAWARDRPQAGRASAVLCCLCQAESSGSRDRDPQPALLSLETPCQKVRGAGVKQLLRHVFACAKTAAARTSHTHTPCTHTHTQPLCMLRYLPVTCTYTYTSYPCTQTVHTHTCTQTHTHTQSVYPSVHVYLHIPYTRTHSLCPSHLHTFTHMHTCPSVPLYV